MECATHPGIEARAACAACARPMCNACASFEIDGAPSCEACGRSEEERARAMTSARLALVAVAYLATLAIGIVLFKKRAFVGGLAVIVAIALSRWLHPTQGPKALRVSAGSSG